MARMSLKDARQLLKRTGNHHQLSELDAASKTEPQKLKDRNGEFEAHLRMRGYSGWQREYWFRKAEGRNSRFDFAWPDLKFAIEVDGGVFNGGYHVRPRGIIADYEKDLAALRLGWVVMRIYPGLFKDQQVWQVIEQFVGGGDDRFFTW